MILFHIALAFGIVGSGTVAAGISGNDNQRADRCQFGLLFVLFAFLIIMSPLTRML